MSSTLSSTMSPPRAAPGRNPALTGIRGVACLWVFCHHLLPALGLRQALPVWAQPFAAMVEQGFRGVDLFFVLSGFILAQVHAREFEALSPARMRRFYLLRVLRIYPLHIVLMLCLLLVVATLPDFVGWMRAQRSPEVFSAAGFWQTIFLVQNWSGYNEAVWNAPAWTLSAEVLGYIAFPFLAYEVLRRTSGRSAAAWGSAVLLALIAATLLSGRATVNPNGGFGLVRMATEFFAGLCLWRYFDSAPGRERHFGLLASVAAAAVLLLCLNAYAAVWTPLAFAALILGLAYRSGLAYRLLSHRSIVWLGEVSYSFYLVHWSVIQLLLWARDDRLLQLPALALTWLAVGAFCLALSWLTYRYVEQPAHRLGHRLARRPMRQATDRTGTAEAQSLEAVVRE